MSEYFVGVVNIAFNRYNNHFVLRIINHYLLNSLPAIGAHERQVFEKLLWGLVSSTIFVRC
jgi:hypothetical protein